MKPLTLMSAIMVLFAASLTAAPKDAKKDKLDGIKCPVKGVAVKENRSVKYRKAKLYFCCPGCVAKFRKTPTKFVVKANHQLVATGQATQEKCPIRFTKLNPEQSLEVAGTKVLFCSAGCKGKVEKAKGDAQLKLVFNHRTFTKAFRVGKKKRALGGDDDEDDEDEDD